MEARLTEILLRGDGSIAWAELTEEERQSIRDELSDSYDPSDELLMINEFQAYTLQADPVSKSFIERHRLPLTEALDAVGLAPIQVQQS